MVAASLIGAILFNLLLVLGLSFLLGGSATTRCNSDAGDPRLQLDDVHRRHQHGFAEHL